MLECKITQRKDQTSSFRLLTLDYKDNNINFTIDKLMNSKGELKKAAIQFFLICDGFTKEINKKSMEMGKVALYITSMLDQHTKYIEDFEKIKIEKHDTDTFYIVIDNDGFLTITCPNVTEIYKNP